MTSSLSDVINYCGIINGSKGFNDTKTQLISEITQDYNTARQDTIYRFDVVVNSIDGKDIYINEATTPLKGVIDISRKQTADTEMEERLQVYPNLIKRGDYIKFKVNDTDTLRTYLIKSKIDKKHGYDEGIFEECNYDLKFIVDNTLYTIPTIVTNNTKYTLGIKSIGGSSIIEGDGMFGLVLSNNDISKLIKIDQRFIVNGQAWKATQTDRVTTKGVLAVLLGETAINYETDDMVLGIADYKTVIPHTYTYNVPTTFEVTKGTSANLVYSIKDELGSEIDYSGVMVTSNSPLATITNTNGVISISGVNIGLGSIKLQVTLDGVLKEFDVAFEVKTDVIAPVISYSCEWSTGKVSNGVSLKTYMSSTANCKETINGVADSTLIVNYSLDSIGSSLVATGSVTITRKSNVDFLVKNVSVSTSKSFIITFTNSVDNSIISTQTVSLSGM